MKITKLKIQAALSLMGTTGANSININGINDFTGIDQDAIDYLDINNAYFDQSYDFKEDVINSVTIGFRR